MAKQIDDLSPRKLQFLKEFSDIWDDAMGDDEVKDNLVYRFMNMADCLICIRKDAEKYSADSSDRQVIELASDLLNWVLSYFETKYVLPELDEVFSKIDEV